MEVMTSAVIDRIMTINNVQVKDNANIAFFNDDKINVSFGWVASADETPDSTKSAGILKVEGNKAIFSYNGHWAMFKLIEEHKMDKNIEYPNGITLQFEVPIVAKNENNSSLTSKMVFKITPLKRDGDKLEPLLWPKFPKICPDLYNQSTTPQNINNNMINNPVVNNISFDQ